MTDLKPCPNPWCPSERKPFIIWDLYSKRVVCRCGVQGPRSKTKANTVQGVWINDEMVPKAEAEAITAWNTRAAPKVKPLEWEHFDAWTSWAETIVGVFRINIRNDSAVILTIGKAVIRYTDEDGEEWGGWPSVEAAKAAAQADYERRILSTLTPETET